MSVLAYSELLKRITGIEEYELEIPFKILNKNNTTQNRLKAIKSLALQEPVSLGKLLSSIDMPRGGGSYITIRKYFQALEKDGLLQTKLDKGKTIWQFSKKGELLKKYILT